MNKKNNYNEIFNNKILNINDIGTLKKFPRKKKLIMCHGTFDIVHPGHIRHLLFAKSKADILLVSVTSDMHISKANYRPYIPANLRAINLAALSFVDYVLIDNHPTPINNLKKIKPDFFAKGFEYNSQNLNPNTSKETQIVESYGGKMLFTPGDIIFSSSKIIDENLPKLNFEKLRNLMESEKITFQNLKEIIKNFEKKKIHIIGDTIVDGFTNCSMIGGMTKTPTMSFKFDYNTKFLGGAGIVAKHLKAAGANVELTTVIGKDDLSKFVIKNLKESRIKTNLIQDGTRPTTYKNAIVSNGYRVIKIDTLENREISHEIKEKISYYLKKSEYDCVIFSDFRHGIFNKNTIQKFSKLIKVNKLKVADSQLASRWGNITDFKNFDLITPNEKEARFALADQDTVIRPLGVSLYKKSKCKNLILKCGSRGILGYRSSNVKNPRSFFSIDSFVENLVDPVGAGDALLAYSSLSLLVSKNIVISAIIGNLAAGLECEVDGNVVIKATKLLDKITEIEKFSS